MDEYSFVEEQPPQPGEAAPPLPAEANGGEKNEERQRSSRSRSRDKRRRSRSRDRKRRSRSRDRKRRSRSRERRRRSRSPVRRSRSPVREDRRPRRRSPTPPEVRAERERQVELDKFDRDARTIFAYNLPLRAEEKEIFQFFIRAGPLNDIMVITDKTTGRSKGFAYIEFARREDVINALSLTGQPLMGQPVMVKMSEAEKNLAWEAAEQAKRQQRELERKFGPEAAAAMMAAAMPGAVAPGMGVPGMMPAGMPQVAVAAGPARLALTNMPTSITESDLRPIFEPFGQIDFVTLQRDTSGRPNGNAFVQYTLLADATKAKENLHGLDLVGHQMGINWAPTETPVEVLAIAAPPPLAPPLPMAGAVQLPEALNEGPDAGNAGGGIKLTGQARTALMSKLAANAGLDTSNVPQLPMPMHMQPQMPSGLDLDQGMLGPASPIPTQCVLLKNMFNPADETEENWDREIAEDVRGECSKYGPVEHVFVDRNSRGFVYVKFGSVPAATGAQRALHGRWFAARQIVAEFQFTPIYNQHFGA